MMPCSGPNNWTTAVNGTSSPRLCYTRWTSTTVSWIFSQETNMLRVVIDFQRSKSSERSDIPEWWWLWKRLRFVVLFLFDLSRRKRSLGFLQHVEDKNLVSAHFAALFGEYDLAQELFLKCGCPLEALNVCLWRNPRTSNGNFLLKMRRDCMQLEAAMALAKAYDPDQIPYISSSHAEQLEFTFVEGNLKFREEFSVESMCFQWWRDFRPEILRARNHKEGERYRARSTLFGRPGALFHSDWRNEEVTKTQGEESKQESSFVFLFRGMNIATRLPGKEIKEDCAKIFESLKQWGEAAELYEKAESWDNAATAYIKTKNWFDEKIISSRQKLDEFRLFCCSGANLEKFYQMSLRRRSIHSMLELERAKVVSKKLVKLTWKRTNGKTPSGETSERTQTNRTEFLFSLLLYKLKSPEQAAKIVRQTQSVEGGKMVANFFESINDYSTAMQFLIVSKSYSEALLLAQKHGLMEHYADVVGERTNQQNMLTLILLSF